MPRRANVGEPARSARPGSVRSHVAEPDHVARRAPRATAPSWPATSISRRSARSWSSRCRPSRGPAIRAPRVHETAAGMINSVGLQGPASRRGSSTSSRRSKRTGARVVAQHLGSHRRATSHAPPSCWPTRRRRSSRSRSTCRAPTSKIAARCSPIRPSATFDVIAATAACRRPRWAKLSPNTFELVEIAAAARRGWRRGRHPHEHGARHGHRHRRHGGRCSARRAVAVRSGHPSGCRACGVRLPRGAPGSADCRSRRCSVRSRCHRVHHGRRKRGTNWYRDVCRPSQRWCDILERPALHVVPTNTA